MNNYKLIYVLFLFVLASCSFEEKTVEVEIENITNWQYRLSDTNNWKRTHVPESVQGIAKSDTLISNFFYKAVFLSNRWTDTVSWEFKSTFKVSENLKNYDYEIEFEKIIGNAEVYLNDSLLFVTNNMFRSWKINVSDLLERGKNNLYIKFSSLKDAKKFAQNNSSINFPSQGYEKLRLAHYFIDTTQGIYYVPLGINGNVKIRKWRKAIVQNVHFETVMLHYDEEATVKATYTIDARSGFTANIQIFNGSDLLANEKISIQKGTKTYSFTFDILNPQLWWTHDTGNSYLYQFNTKFLSNDELIQDFITGYGLRDLKIDTINNNFQLYLNDTPLKLKIIDYLPISAFSNTLTKSDYKKSVFDIARSGINMVHVIEDGIYEKNVFYNECDKQGVLVWQDFMIPYKIFDTTDNFVENIRQEAIYNIVRLRNHPSLAFWSGQNDFKSYFDKYVSSNNFNKTDSCDFLKTNKLVFDVILKKAVEKYDSNSFYFENVKSPAIFTIINKYPSFPKITTLRKVTSKPDRVVNSRMLKYYQRPTNSDSLISANFLQNNLDVKGDWSAYIYANQALSCFLFEKKAVETRLNSSYNAVIYGIYRDYSPIISNSLVDYNGFWKGEMYALSRTLKNFMINMNENAGDLSFDILSDLDENISVDIYLKLYNFDGKVFWRKNMISTTIFKHQVKEYFSFNLSRELYQIGKNQAVLKVEVFYNQELYYDKYFLFAPDNRLNLKTPNIKKKYFKVDDGYVIELTTDYFARHVYIYTEKDGSFSDNFVNIAPGETKKIYFYTPNDIYAIEGAFKVVDYTQIFDSDLFSFD